MKKFVMALVFVAALEAVTIALAINSYSQVAAGSPVSIRMVILAVVVFGLPPLIAVGLWQRFRRNRVRRAALESFAAISPEHLTFSADPTDRFFAEINRLRQASGMPPVVNNRMPLIVSISPVFMTIYMTSKKAHPGTALMLSTLMIAGVSVESISHPMPGTRKSVTLETLRVSLTRAPGLDLFIPVQVHELGSSSRQDLQDVAAAVTAKLPSTAPR